MYHSLRYRLQDDILEITLDGPVRACVILALATRVARTTVLLDVRHCDRHPRPTEIYQQVQHYPVAAKALRIAIVCLPLQWQAATFYETVAVNRGYRFRCFTDRALALAWLHAVPPSLGV